MRSNWLLALLLLVATAPSGWAAGPSISEECQEENDSCREDCTLQYGSTLRTASKLGLCLERCKRQIVLCQEAAKKGVKATASPASTEPDFAAEPDSGAKRPGPGDDFRDDGAPAPVKPAAPSPRPEPIPPPPPAPKPPPPVEPSVKTAPAQPPAPPPAAEDDEDLPPILPASALSKPTPAAEPAPKPAPATEAAPKPAPVAEPAPKPTPPADKAPKPDPKKKKPSDEMHWYEE